MSGKNLQHDNALIKRVSREVAFFLNVHEACMERGREEGRKRHVELS